MKASFSRADLKRGIQAAREAGVPVAAIDFPKQGGFRILVGDPVRLETATLEGANEWDEVLRDAS